eukprot:3357709-Rhodomonas_salina.1
MGRSPLRQVLLSKRTYGAHYSILKEGSRGCVAQARSTPRMGHHLQLYRAQLSAANTDRQRTAHAQTVLLQRCLSTPKGFGGSFSRLRKNRGLLSMTAPSEPPSKTRSDLSISRAHRHHLEHQQSFIGLPQNIPFTLLISSAQDILSSNLRSVLLGGELGEALGAIVVADVVTHVDQTLQGHARNSVVQATEHCVCCVLSSNQELGIQQAAVMALRVGNPKRSPRFGRALGAPYCESLVPGRSRNSYNRICLRETGKTVSGYLGYRAPRYFLHLAAGL